MLQLTTSHSGLVGSDLGWGILFHLSVRILGRGMVGSITGLCLDLEARWLVFLHFLLKSLY